MHNCVRAWPLMCTAILALAVDAPAQETQKPLPTRPSSSQPASQPSRTEAVPFRATSLSDDEIVFPAAYKGKLVLLTFWATWCPHCRAEVKYWREVYDKFHDAGLVMIGLPTDQSRATAREKVVEFVKNNGLVWPQVFDDAPKISRSYAARAVPWSFLIDADTGKIVAQRQELRKEALAKTIAEQLAIKQGRPLPAATSQPATTQPAATRASAGREE